MKLNRRKFLQVTGLAGVLAAFGIELPEAAKKLPAATPPTGQIKIQYNTAEQGGRWTSLDERDEARVLGAFRKPPPHSPGLRVHKFHHALAVPDELIRENGSIVPVDFGDWLKEYYVKAIEAEMLEVT